MFFEGGEEGQEGFAQRVVERVHRSVAFVDGVNSLAVDFDLHRGLAGLKAVLAAVETVRGVVFDEIEDRLVLADLLADEHFKRSLGGFELAAFAFEALHLGKDGLHLGAPLANLKPMPSAFTSTFDWPDMSEMLMMRWLPTSAGSTCS
jgi:hypothetical protein